MADFQYQGVDRSGKKVSGNLSANSEGDLRMLLRNQGIRPTKITKAGALSKDLGSLVKGVGSVPSDALVGFTRQLQILISSGIPLVQALDVLSEQAVNPNLKTIIGVVREKVSQGTYLWEALALYPKAFPKLYVALVRAGEASGSLDQMLKRLTRYVEDADHLKKMLKSAMMYPVIVISIGIGVVGLMLVFVIPKFEDMLKGNGQELPLPTQIVITSSHFLINNIVVIMGAVIGSVVMIVKYLQTPEGRAFMDRTLFNVPMFGTMMQKAGVARFSRTMQTLLASGVSLVDAIDVCKSTIDNAVLEEAVGKIRGEVESGKTLGSVVSKMSVFPRMAVQMIAIGESTGGLDKMLEKVADFYEAEVETLIGGLTKLIEPFILVFLGTTVGGIMIAMYLPIFKMAGGND